MRFESQFSRMNCQMFSTGFSSGHLDGSPQLPEVSRTAETASDALCRAEEAIDAAIADRIGAAKRSSNHGLARARQRVLASTRR